MCGKESPPCAKGGEGQLLQPGDKVMGCPLPRLSSLPPSLSVPGLWFTKTLQETQKGVQNISQMIQQGVTTLKGKSKESEGAGSSVQAPHPLFPEPAPSLGLHFPRCGRHPLGCLSYWRMGSNICHRKRAGRLLVRFLPRKGSASSHCPQIKDSLEPVGIGPALTGPSFLSSLGQNTTSKLTALEKILLQENDKFLKGQRFSPLEKAFFQLAAVWGRLGVSTEE